MKIEKVNIKELKAAPYNPRVSTPDQEEHLRKSLEKYGLVEPIIWNKKTGHIVGGHFRVRELEKMGKRSIDCVVVNLSLKDEKELNIRLNANTGSWDWGAIKEWDSEELSDWGFDVPEFGDPTDDEGIDTKGSSLNIRITVKDAKEDDRDKIKELLKDNGFDVK